MIFKKKSWWTDPLEYKGDKVLIPHKQYIGHIIEDVDRQRKEGAGWNKSRTMKKIASIPPLEFAKIGHKIAPGGTIDKKELQKYLETPEGERFCINDDKVDPRKGEGPLIVVH